MVPGGAGGHPLPYMEHDPLRPSLPAIPAPPTFSERRHAFRRGEDLAVHEDRALLARALDILAGPGDAATQVADILALLARVVGARRAALVTDRPLRRVIVVAAPGEDPADAHHLAAWLDANGLRSAAVRAASSPAEVIVVRTRQDHLARAGAPATAPAKGEHLADRMVRLGARGAEVQVGLELASARDAARVAVRLPRTGAAAPARGARRSEPEGRGRSGAPRAPGP